MILQEKPGMDVYSVVQPSVHDRISLDSYKNKNLNILFTFKNSEYKNLKGFNKTNILIDSGAFHFNFLGRPIKPGELEKFIETYVKFIKENRKDSRIKGFFDLDLLFLPYHEITTLRKMLLDLTPSIIMVYHPKYGLDEFKRMCEQYDNIAICNNEDITTNGYSQLVKYAHKKNCYIHGLGINDNRVLNKVPFNSVDSSNWAMGAIREYYFFTDIPKTPENNKKYRALYEKKAFLKQLQKQEHYKKYWSVYFNLLNQRR